MPRISAVVFSPVITGLLTDNTTLFYIFYTNEFEILYSFFSISMEPGNKTILDVYIKILRSLECPVCYEYILPPIYQCNAGHILCGKCRKDIQNCPECRASMPKELRARKLEELSENMIYPCRNSGCELIVSAKDLENHEKSCPHFTGRAKAEDAKNNQHTHTVLLHHIEEKIAPFLEIKSDKISLDEECQTDIIQMRDVSTYTHSKDNYEKGPYFMSGVMVPVNSLSKEALVKGQEKQVYGFLDSAKNYLGRHLNNNKPYNYPVIDLNKSLIEMRSITNSFTSGIGHSFSNEGEGSSWHSNCSILQNRSRNYSLHERSERDSTLQDISSELDYSNTDMSEEDKSDTDISEEVISDTDKANSGLSKSDHLGKLLSNLLDKQNESMLEISSLKCSTVSSSASKQESQRVSSDHSPLSEIKIGKNFTLNLSELPSLNISDSHPKTKKYTLKYPGEPLMKVDRNQSLHESNNWNFEKNCNNVFVFKGKSEGTNDLAQKNDSTNENEEVKTKSTLFTFNDVNENLDSYAKKAEETFKK